MVWIRSRIFRDPKPKHIKEGHPNIGHVLNKRRRKHFKEGPFNKPSATLALQDPKYLYGLIPRVPQRAPFWWSKRMMYGIVQGSWSPISPEPFWRLILPWLSISQLACGPGTLQPTVLACGMGVCHPEALSAKPCMISKP